MAKRAEIVGLYPENGWDYDSIESILKSRTSIKRYILALHDQDVDADGKPVKPHHHVYLDFGNTNWQYEDIAKWFNIPPNNLTHYLQQLYEFKILLISNFQMKSQSNWKY